jgi:phosphatidate cytidylyltransferase
MIFSPGMVTALLGVLGLLLVATAVIFTLSRTRPQQDFTELILRVKTWWVIVAVFCVVILSSRDMALWVLGFVSFLAFKEFLTLIPTRRADAHVLFWAYLAIPIQFYWVHIAWYGMFIIFIPVYMFLFLPMRMVIAGEPAGFLRSIGIINWGLMITVFSLSHMAYLLALPQPAGAAYSGASLLLFLMVLTQLNDVAQYLWGKALGRRKIVPGISPNKTWAGFLGGVVTTAALSYGMAPALTPLSHQESWLAGGIIGMVGFAGDVVMSAVKRDMGVKDSGNLLPGHGGMLDRLDSLTYTAPLFFHFVYYFHY